MVSKKSGKDCRFSDNLGLRSELALPIKAPRVYAEEMRDIPQQSGGERSDMDKAVDRSRPPSRLLLALEVRAIWELQAFLAAYPLLRRAPRGDGHPVLVLPGLAASDVSTGPLRTYLRAQGYAAHGWKQGPNNGPRTGVEAGIDARLAELAQRYNRKVSLIGWSLGGVFAREAARRSSDLVRQVITLGSPFANEPKASNAWRLYEVLSGRQVDDWPGREAMKLPPPVPSTAIYSRSDGIVAWQGCCEQESATTENIEVEGSHSGLGHNPMALYAIADRLALPEGDWRPFDRSGLRSLLYSDPNRRDGDREAALRADPITAQFGRHIA
jgi:pimeloyl-ACP methyl ester carboxylesterase